MSEGTSFPEDSLETLARLELLQGVVPPEESASLRDLIYLRLPAGLWVDRARIAYEEMAGRGGFVASVGDLLSAELDILDQASLYAAIGGFPASEITHGLGAWWSPTATWFQSGRVLLEESNLEDPTGADFDVFSQLLLRAGARSLVTFFAAVASGGQRAVDSPRARRRPRTDARAVAFVVAVARHRGRLFRDGPREDGRYLGSDAVSVGEIHDVTLER